MLADPDEPRDQRGMIAISFPSRVERNIPSRLQRRADFSFPAI
ncbi:hypothetical protein [Mesorhizobium sp. B4-1-4]|nr:hypothetical protein [Mesorhizobium sp. B4-1-4]